MATIINNPDSGGNGGGAGLILGVIASLAIIALFIIYGLPALRGNNTGETNIKIPDKIEVNINQ